MSISMVIASLVVAATPMQSEERIDVAYDVLAAGQNGEAIRRIEANEQLERDDSARLINLGVAHAREGDYKTARAAFEAVILNHDNQFLETGSGSWVDSRDLARQALAMLESGQFDSGSRFAKR